MMLNVLVVTLAAVPSLHLTDPTLLASDRAPAVTLIADRVAEAPLRLTLLADAESYDIVKTKDGKVHTGHIIKELEQGLLFRPADADDTLVLKYDQVVDIQKTVPAQGASPERHSTGRVVVPAEPPAPALQELKLQSDRRLLLQSRVQELRSKRDQLSIGTSVAGLLLSVLGAVVCLAVLDSPQSYLLAGAWGIIGTVSFFTMLSTLEAEEKLDTEIGALQAELGSVPTSGRLDRPRAPLGQGLAFRF